MATNDLSIWQQDITTLRGVGPKMAEKLAKRGIRQVIDLLFYLPYRYQDRTRITPIGAVKINEYAVIEGTTSQVQMRFGNKASMTCKLSDASGSITLRFFHFHKALKETLSLGARLRCFGEVRYYQNNFHMVHPEYTVIHDDKLVAVEETLTPIYHATTGLNQKTIRQLINQVLSLLEKGEITDYLPESLTPLSKNISLKQALSFIHLPPPDADTDLLTDGEHPAQQRLSFEELLAYQLAMLKQRHDVKMQIAPALLAVKSVEDKLLQQLGFQLTQAQRRVCDEISDDLATAQPMMRLVQGDVGSGKTVVAALAALQTVSHDFQVALMAPTEILATQHYNTLSKWLNPLGVNTLLLTGKIKQSVRKTLLQQIAEADAHIVIGTHALFQKDIHFAKLGLVIIDEQHRFGVHQRLALKEKGHLHEQVPHQLIMTATPIPRTLAMTAYGDLDISTIDELPPGRKPITTAVVANEKRTDVISRIHEMVKQGRQVYWVCTLIEESEALQCQNAQETFEMLQQALPDLRVALIHGRMKPEEKEHCITAFAQHEYDLLVATTVIEVGVDIPNANLMVIENAERLGLAQLHQLRGRVGRGEHQSFCLLLYQAPLSENAKERLMIMRDSQDGFKIAKKDLELRGPGEVLGTQQAGLASLKIACLMRDQDLLPEVKAAAQTVMQNHKSRIAPIISRWLADKEKYAEIG